MAIILSDKYPGRSNPPSLDYPQGSIKDQSAPQAKDGTPLKADWANDHEGFFQSLLKEADITANGNVDTAVSSQYFDALKVVIAEESPTPSQATETTAGVAKVATSAIIQSGVNNDSFATAKGIKDSGLWPLGIGQSILDLTSSRAKNTTYTNSTNRLIFCFVLFSDVGYPGEWVFNGVSIGPLDVGGTVGQSFFFPVPAGWTYRFNDNAGSVVKWLEIR